MDSYTPLSGYEQKMIEAFVDKEEKTLWYQHAFSRYSINGIESLQWVWSWWAFFGGVFYLLYRKAYLAALGLFVLSFVASSVPLAGLIVWVLSGGYGVYFVRRVYLDRKREIEAHISVEDERIETMRRLGGCNNWVIWVYAAFVLLTMIGVIYAIVAVSMLTEP